jgi:hypothetical protein
MALFLLVLLLAACFSSSYYIPKTVQMRPLSLRSDSGIPVIGFGDIINEVENAREWYSVDGCSILLPYERTPRAVIHFIGGFVAGVISPVAYGKILMSLANAGYLICVSPIPAFDIEHGNTVASISSQFSYCYQKSILPLMGPEGRMVPIIGLSHSLGGKFTALLCSRKQDRKSIPPRLGNVYMAFNNYGLSQSLELSQSQIKDFSPEMQKVMSSVNLPQFKNILNMARSTRIGDMFSNLAGKAVSQAAQLDPEGDFADTVSKRVSALIGNNLDNAAEKVGDSFQQILDAEFDPTPQETLDLISDGYNVQNNVLIRFVDDEIDETHKLQFALQKRGGCDIDLLTLTGDHLTPLTVSPEGVQRKKEIASKQYLATDVFTNDRDLERDLLRVLNELTEKGLIETNRRFQLK